MGYPRLGAREMSTQVLGKEAEADFQFHSIQFVPEPNPDSTWSVVAYWTGSESRKERQPLWKCERQEDACYLLQSYWVKLSNREHIPGLYDAQTKRLPREILD